MTKMKTIFVIIFLALLIPVLLKAPESEAKVYQGKWKNNTTWNYDTRENTLMIKCCGKMIDDIEDCGEHSGWPRFYTSAQKIVLVKGITYIGSGAFEGFSHIKKIQIPNGVTQIGKSAFEDCYKLHKIYFPETLKSIENDAFNATAIEEISLKNIEFLGESCFSGSQLKKVHILRKNKKIGAYIFEGCKKLKKATIEKGVKNISDGMFRATALKNITIPGSVTKIGEDAFSYCQNLKKATLHEGVKKISKDAFSNTALEEITIPSTVTKLGKNAFRWDSTEKSSLKKVVIRSPNIKKWGTMVFGATRDDLVIYVPQSKKAEYEKILRSTNGLDFHAKIVGKKW